MSLFQSRAVVASSTRLFPAQKFLIYTRHLIPSEKKRVLWKFAPNVAKAADAEPALSTLELRETPEAHQLPECTPHPPLISSSWLSKSGIKLPPTDELSLRIVLCGRPSGCRKLRLRWDPLKVAWTNCRFRWMICRRPVPLEACS